MLKIEVYQGEGRRVDDNIRLGHFDLPLPDGKKGDVAADVRFTYDADGLLEVEATPLKNGVPAGKPVQLAIAASENRLSPEEVKRRLALLSNLKIHPRDSQPTRTLMARAERHYGQLLGEQRDALGDAMFRFEASLETQDERRMAAPRRALEEMLQFLDSNGMWLDEAPS
ncbi:Hsp70 protein [Xylophilus ampelinus]|uniref:Hsp70 protein n=1 Tax=Xylophilus ampelinus TaxID=54067 RepID=A0A318SP28_9BURK|nr:Hsp70 protein [Xylophilus ampelinus]